MKIIQFFDFDWPGGRGRIPSAPWIRQWKLTLTKYLSCVVTAKPLRFAVKVRWHITGILSIQGQDAEN